jgi:hypothetical protein
MSFCDLAVLEAVGGIEIVDRNQVQDEVNGSMGRSEA